MFGVPWRENAPPGASPIRTRPTPLSGVRSVRMGPPLTDIFLSYNREDQARALKAAIGLLHAPIRADLLRQAKCFFT